MAFYSAKVDEAGRELERRPSLQSVSAAAKLTSCTSSRPSCRSYRSSCTSTRSVNSGKTTDESDAGSICNGFGMGMIQIVSDDEGSNIVPLLDIQSENSFRTTTCGQTYTHKHFQGDKAQFVLPPDVAYTAWLSAKQKLFAEKAEQRKKAEAEEREKEEARKRMADKKFQDWLAVKSRQQTHSQKEVKSMQKSTQVNKAVSQEKLAAWHFTKQAEIQGRRKKQQHEEQRRNEVAELRRQKSAAAWEKWSAEAKKKPKPVPLSRGISSFRGTVSDIFINPNEWNDAVVSVDDSLI